MRSPTLVFEKFGTYQSSAMVPCFRTKSLMVSSLLLYSSTVGFTFWFCVSWGSLSVHCAIALVCMPVLSVGISLSASFIYLFFFSSITACYWFAVSLSTLFLLFSLGPFSSLSREFLFLNWLVYLALPDEVSICLSQGYCLLSLEKISWLPLLAGVYGTSGRSVNWLITSVINSAAGWLILGACSYCFCVEWGGGIDVLQLLFLRYLQGCVNSCHHLLTPTGINCCV